MTRINERVERILYWKYLSPEYRISFERCMVCGQKRVVLVEERWEDDHSAGWKKPEILFGKRIPQFGLICEVCSSKVLKFHERPVLLTETTEEVESVPSSERDESEALAILEELKERQKEILADPELRENSQKRQSRHAAEVAAEEDMK